MNNMEERLWSYIDGTCPADEKQAIDILIAQDEAWRNMYQELLNFNIELNKMEADEPSMAFTYKVMEGVRAAHAQKPLKARINKGVIWGISGFFVLTITILLGYALLNTSFSMPSISSLNIQLPANFKVPEVKGFFSGPVINGFLFFDVVLGLFLFDALLRKRKVSKQV